MIFFWLRGWVWLLVRPRHLLLVMAPLILGFMLAVGFFWLAYLWTDIHAHRLLGFFAQWFPWEHLYTAWQSFGYWMFFVLLLLFFAGAALFLFYGIYIVLCAPFYSILVESVLKEQGILLPRRLTLFHWFRLSLKMLAVSLVKGLLFASIGFIAFMISMVPGLNFMVLIVAATIFAFDSMDYSFEVLGLSLKQRFSYFKRHRAQLFWMSVSMTLTLLVPGLTFLALPGAVVGAALMVRPNAGANSV